MMTNHEKYKLAFSRITPREDFLMEAAEMKEKRNNRMIHKAAATAAACLVLVGSAVTAYAADLGGIQRTLQLWLHGDQTQVTLSFDGNGGYSMSYTDRDGAEQQKFGGGQAVDHHGNIRPLTEEELIDGLNAPQVEVEDGRIFVCWQDQKVDITDQFEDGVCYVKLGSEDEIRYLTVYENGGYVVGDGKFLAPENWRVLSD